MWEKANVVNVPDHFFNPPGNQWGFGMGPKRGVAGPVVGSRTARGRF